MNKSDFIVRLAGNLDDTQVATKAMLETTLETVAEVLAEGDSVELHGFGKFEVVERNARKGRNPKTGEAVEVPAKKAVKFSAFASLKDVVNE